jgi:hypothetical protein
MFRAVHLYDLEFLMSKKKSSGRPLVPPNNPVAKYAVRFNRAGAFGDRTRYSRKLKHRGSEPSLIGSLSNR